MKIRVFSQTRDFFAVVVTSALQVMKFSGSNPVILVITRPYSCK